MFQTQSGFPRRSAAKQEEQEPCNDAVEVSRLLVPRIGQALGFRAEPLIPEFGLFLGFALRVVPQKSVAQYLDLDASSAKLHAVLVTWG